MNFRERERMDYIIAHSDSYLMHYGVKGMKWGVRKEPEASNVKTKRTGYYSDGRPSKLVSRAKAADKRASKAYRDYSTAFNKAYNFQYFHPISSFIGEKNSKKSDKLWNNAADKANAVNTTRKEARTANKEARDYQRYRSVKDVGKAYMSQIDVYRKTYSEVKKATGLRNKAVTA